MADLRAAENVLELPAGRPREIPGTPHNNYAVKLAEGYRLVLALITETYLSSRTAKSIGPRSAE